jgi:predicted phage terminase large subunit-like protein
LTGAGSAVVGGRADRVAWPLLSPPEADPASPPSRPSSTDGGRVDAALAALLPLAGPIAARASLGEYILRMFPGEYEMARHHEIIIEHMEAVERGEIKRLAIFVGPRRGKSLIASVHFPAWYLGRNPDCWFMSCSHTAELAHDFSRKVRRQLTDPLWPFEGVKLRRDEAAVGQWGIAGRQGGYIAAGVGGSLTGRGASALNIDDPIKGREQAMSAVYRDRAWDWYISDAYTRLAPGGAIILTMTRWHADDPAGRILKSMSLGGERWDVLCMREVAEAGDDDPLGREPGQYLWPSRWPPEATDVIRTTQPAVWESLFQQRPGAVTGSMFKRAWFDDENRYDPAVLPHFQLVVVSVDSAFSTNVSADYSVIQVWGATKEALYVLDVWRDRVEYPDLLTAIRDMFALWRDKLSRSPAVYIEDKASGHSAIQTLRRESSLPIYPYKPGAVAKEARAQDVTPYFGTGRVRIPTTAPWLHDFVEEFVAFPTGEHDDQVDAAGIAIYALTRAVRITGVTPETKSGDD